MHLTCAISARHIAGMPVYTVAPRTGAVAHHSIYLHGGAYTYEISRPHWRLIRNVALRTPAIVEVPIYTLAPRATAAVTVPAITDLLVGLIDGAGDEPVTLIGDSAGGGLALAAVEALRDRGGAQPDRIVLISPWLDVTMEAAQQRALETLHRPLRIAGLTESGRLYAGELELHDPRVSPLFGDLHGLAPLTVFSGTADIVNVDSAALRDRASAAGVDVEYIEGPGLPHVYPLMPIPEGRLARAHIVQRLRATVSNRVVPV